MKIVIIGGVAGGATAAARLRRVSETAEIVLVERGPYISFANCGLPYHISGAIAEREQLLVTAESLFEARYHVDVRSRTEALSIDRAAKTVRLRNLETGVETDEPYDRLLLSPGAEGVRPRKISGIDSKRIFTLHNIPDLDRIMAALGENRPRRAVVIGGGYIGLEVAENFHERGLFTTVVEGAAQILAPFDEEMAAIVHAHMRDKAIELYLDDKIEHFEDRPDHVVVFLASGKRIQADIVVMSIGVRPETKLAREAGLELGATGGIKVDDCLATSDPDIFAVGDAIEVVHRVSGKPALIPLAGPANRQARIVADNMLASDPAARQRYGGTMGTAILKAFDLAAACTGLNETQAKALEIPHRAIDHPRRVARVLLSRQPAAQPEARLRARRPHPRRAGDRRRWRRQAHRRHRHGDQRRPERAGPDRTRARLCAAVRLGQGSGQCRRLRREQRALGLPRDHRLARAARHAEIRAGVDPARRRAHARGVLDPDAAGARATSSSTICAIGSASSIPSRPVVVFCQVGLRGYLAYRILKQAGLQGRPQPDGRLQDLRLGDREAVQSRPVRLREHQAARRRRRSRPNAAPATSRSPATCTSSTRSGCNVPGPIMKAFKAMAAMEVGETLEITASDPAFGRDIRAWATRTGNELLSVGSSKGLVTARVRKASPRRDRSRRQAARRRRATASRWSSSPATSTRRWRR